MKRRRKLWHECYQLAGGLLIGPAYHFTEGQRERLIELLLNVLSDPDSYTAKLVHTLREMAVAP